MSRNSFAWQIICMILYYAVADNFTDKMNFPKDEFGEECFVWGEVFPDLQCGGGMLTAEKSYSGEDFGYPSTRELFGEDTIVFGLANDAIGYIVPDNDYVLCFDSDNHYHELFSAGKNTASTLITELQSIKEEISSVS